MVISSSTRGGVWLLLPTSVGTQSTYVFFSDPENTAIISDSENTAIISINNISR
jgi:hypothetical protein